MLENTQTSSKISRQSTDKGRQKSMAYVKLIKAFVFELKKQTDQKNFSWLYGPMLPQLLWLYLYFIGWSLLKVVQPVHEALTTWV